MNEQRETPARFGQSPAAARPPGYPTELERILSLRDGRPVFVRPVIPADELAFEREWREADPETLYQRFFTPQPKLDARRLHSFTHVDYQWRLALVAFAEDDQAVGIARYEGARRSGIGGNRFYGEAGVATRRTGERAVGSAGRSGTGAEAPTPGRAVPPGQPRHGHAAGQGRVRATTGQRRRRRRRDHALIEFFVI